MAMGSTGGGEGLSSDINVTPLIDVLLVLLIIFMITQPLSRKAFDVQVPPEQQTKQKQQQSSQIVLELKADGAYAINGQPYSVNYRLKHMETVLAAREWLVGRFSVADILMADVLRLVDRFGGLADYPACKTYLERATARPAFVKAHADQMAHFAAAD